jgi:hypothetical protein
VIRIILETKVRPFARILARREVARSTRFYLGLEFTNLSEDGFPGGKIEQLFLEHYESGTSKRRVLGEAANIAEIEPGESWTSTLMHSRVEWEGITHIRVKVAASDGIPVDCYHVPGGVAGKGQWNHFFHSTNRESLIMVDLLSRILNRLEPGRAT